MTPKGRQPPPAALAAAAPLVDGRHRRTQDSQQRIIAAMLDLVQAGEVDPSADAVATRADVGLRSVFRHFNDMETLFLKIAAKIEEDVGAEYSKPYRTTNWRENLAELTERRGRMFDRLLPYRRSANYHRFKSAFVKAQIVGLNKALRARLSEVLPKPVVRDTVAFESLDMLLSFDTWIRLRDEQGLSARRAHHVVSGLVTALLASTHPG